MSKKRWPIERAQDWSTKAGWLVGCNFTPSSAGNQLEMWQQATFDAETIHRELSWAADLGMNVIRVYLHDLVYQVGESAFLERVDQVLTMAAEHGISMMPVLFDGVWHPVPKLGDQPHPKPNLHNSMWVQGPGRDVLYDQSRWPALRPYVDAVLRRFGDDPRVVAWDLFNEPDQIDRDTIALGSRDQKAEYVTELVDVVFDWARAVNPMQPLTVGLWEYDADHRPAANALNELILDRSDVISFHCYEPRSELTAVIAALAEHGRPLLCTEWLARTAGSTVDLLDVFAQHSVGAINWGLVDGRTQTRFPWRSWTETVPDDEPWFHELLHANGTAYDNAEVEIFRSLTST